MHRRKLATAVVVLALALAGGVGLWKLALDREGSESPTETASRDGAAPPKPLRLEVDRALVPAVSEVGPGEAGYGPRRVGHIEDADGDSTDLVLEEAMVVAESRAALEEFLTRWGAEVLGQPEEDGVVVALVRVLPRDVDAAAVAARLQQEEPELEGLVRVSEESILTLLAMLADSYDTPGVDVSLNWVAAPMGIREGETSESPDLPPGHRNPFAWPYYRVGGALDIGVGAAWQLLAHYGRLVPPESVPILVVDGGFEENEDFPVTRRIHYADWNVTNPGKCSGGNECPWHGTDVSLTAVAQVDNGYGVAGVAGPVAALEALQSNLDFWTEIRRARNVTRDVDPAVVNMSFGWDVKYGKKGSEYFMDLYAKQMVDAGALPVAAAGNEGANVDEERRGREKVLNIPCESEWVLCVGGTAPDQPLLHSGSNYGSKGGRRSVEIYAPYCVYSIKTATAPSIEVVCGTSFSAPFVSGVAALVKAAHPELGPWEIRDLLLETAHGGLETAEDDNRRVAADARIWVNAFAAVMEALGVEPEPPTVSILSPANGKEVSVTEWVELRAEAFDFKGQPLPVAWVSSAEPGELGEGLDPVHLPPGTLATGVHVIRAVATDYRGVSRQAAVSLHVVDREPELTILTPADGAFAYAGVGLALSGYGLDPDTQQFLDGSLLFWSVERDGKKVYGATGTNAHLPATLATPGTYRISLRTPRPGYPYTAVEEPGAAVERVVSVTLVPVPNGENPPVAKIVGDLRGGEVGTTGDPVTFQLSGSGSDPEDGAIPGTRYRWVARSEFGEEVVLCTGSNFGAEAGPTPTPKPFNPPIAGTNPTPTPGLPSFGIVKNCATTEAKLGLAPGKSVTHWTITLEVKDSAGLVGSVSAVVRISFVVP